MSDIFIFNTFDGGDIEINNGLLTRTGGIDSSVFLSLFGGNEDDAGGQDTAQAWWGNINEEDPLQYRSRTQNLLKALPPTSFNLRRIEDAAQADLKWLLDTNTATRIDVTATIPALNRIQITVDVEAFGVFEYIENWRTSA